MENLPERFKQEGGTKLYSFDTSLDTSDTEVSYNQGGGELSPHSKNWKQKYLEMKKENKELKRQIKYLEKQIKS